MNRTAIVVKPNQRFVEWLHSVDPSSIDLTLADVTEDPSVYLLPESDSAAESVECLRRYCGQIFDEQLEGWYRVPEEWPQKRDFKAFTEWFDYTVHSMVLDTSGDRPIAD